MNTIIALLLSLQLMVGADASLRGERQAVQSKQTNDVPIARVRGTNDGVSWIVELKRSDVENAPEWDGQSPPPLSARAAVAAAKAYLLNQRVVVPDTVGYPDPERWWICTEISLHKWIWSKDKWWYYKMLWRPVKGAPVTVFVTMDAKVSPISAVTATPKAPR